jgi:hypothetical protein
MLGFGVRHFASRTDQFAVELEERPKTLIIKGSSAV